eukprot:XP_027328736.1 cleavage and polyadenylation specificity factor subunit 6-like [Anas platyrhynchos]
MGRGGPKPRSALWGGSRSRVPVGGVPGGSRSSGMGREFGEGGVSIPTKALPQIQGGVPGCWFFFLGGGPRGGQGSPPPLRGVPPDAVGKLGGSGGWGGGPFFTGIRTPPAPPTHHPRGAPTMRLRMISAASILVLLFLPSETSSPLRWPPPRLPGAPQPNWEAWSGTPRPPPGGAASTTTVAPPPRDPRGLQAGKRREGKPNSLDLTFHLLREFLEMSREERLAQKALSNKLLLQSIGK